MDRATMQNLFLYGGGGGAPQGQQGNSNEGMGGNPGDQGQQGMGYPGLFPASLQPYFSQSQQAAAAAHQAAAMAEARLNAQAYAGGGGGMEGYDPRFAANFSQQNYGDAQAQQEYMDANRLLLQRLHAGQGAPNQWGFGYGMPQAPQGMDAYAESGMLGPWSTTSAGLLGKMGPEEKTKKVRKKHKDKPKRPLSAYNLFFKDERQNILKAIPNKEDEEEGKKEDEESKEGEDDKDETEESKKRKRKKAPHGKIGFENLAKIIGQRWQKLESDRVEHYKKLAAKDMKRYKEEMEVFLTKIENEKKAKQEMADGVAPAPAPEEAEEGDEPPAKKAKTEDSEGDDEDKNEV